MHHFGCIAHRATSAYFFFIGISAVIYIVQLAESIITIKNNQETRWLCKLSRSLQLVFEDVPLPVCLLIIFFYEPRIALANPAMVASCTKLVSLIWGIVEFIKIKFCWFCLPCTKDHGFEENCQRCWTPTIIHVAMFVVNLCHGLAIGLTIFNIIVSSRGGIVMPEHEYPPCDLHQW